jgi:hypothetical protein
MQNAISNSVTVRVQGKLVGPYKVIDGLLEGLCYCQLFMLISFIIFSCLFAVSIHNLTRYHAIILILDHSELTVWQQKLLIPNTTIGYNPDTVPYTYHSHKLFPF